MSSVEKKIQNYIKARQEKEKAGRAKSLAETEFRRAERELADHYLNNDVQNFKQGGCTFSLKQQFRPSLTMENTPAIKEWIKSRGEELSDYVKESLSSTATKSLLLKVWKDEGEFALPGGSLELAKIDLSPGISVLGWNENYKETS